MYSINQDPYQLTNLANLLKNETIQHYLVKDYKFFAPINSWHIFQKIMEILKKCKGAECNNVWTHMLFIQKYKLMLSGGNLSNIELGLN